MRTPNNEQLLAIKHDGGVVLRAGAGSGKTFVLVEHFIHLMNEFRNKNKLLATIDLEGAVRKYLSSLVFMTFTKKAAAELEIRLQGRIISEKDHHKNEVAYWEIIEKELSHLTISTIHGFCFKLISQGFFSHIDPKVAIISEKAQFDRIEELTTQWLEKVASDQSQDEVFIRQLLLSSHSLATSMSRIFSDPEVRLMWQEGEGKPQELPFFEFYSTVARELEVEEILSPVVLADTGKKTPSYVAILEDYNRFLSLGEAMKPSDFDSVFAGKKLMKPKDNLEIATYIELLADMRKFIKKHQDSLNAYYDTESKSASSWFQALRSLFTYINAHYLNVKGITFSDLEYYVFKGLENRETCSLIAKNYNYFVVDEYQDTSEIQFQILQKLTLGESKRIFCVGDLKQAIYGFRGGDIGVFRKTMALVTMNLDLKMNYRSSRKVIEFNNSLFHYVMPLASGYAGHDKHSVLFEEQSVPDTCENLGSVTRLDFEITRPIEEADNKRWPTNSVLNHFEAQILVRKIEEIIKREPSSDIAILYSKLSPSLELTQLLMQLDATFSAQVKIIMSEDPVMSMAALLIPLDEEVSTDGAIILLNAYLEALRLNSRVDNELLHDFMALKKLWGSFEALLRFFWNIGISNSNFAETFERLRDLYRQAGGDDEEFLLKIKDVADDRYSIEFQYSGGIKSKIQIMTAHASKGLEFSHVLLGGIYTNGRKNPSNEDIGMKPGSFKWSPDGKKTSSYTTPQFILEKKQNDLRNFSEGKRLFYVACTRAKDSLYWANLKEDGMDVRFENDSWIAALRAWEVGSTKAPSCYDKEACDVLKEGRGSSKIPFFHYDNLGLFEKSEKGKSLVTLADLSVTRLASLVSCPRKFYLKNILKFDAAEFDAVLDIQDEEARAMEAREDIAFEDDSEKVASNLKIERGLRLHESLSLMIKARNVVPLKTLAEDKAILENVSKRISLHFSEGREIHSEEPLKFDFFGHMISGIPDLFILDKKNHVIEVWDFKTGRSNESKDLVYWFQVAAYAHALSRKYKFTQIKLALYYIDQDDFKEYNLTADQNDHFLRSVWNRIYNLDKIDTNHCKVCEFGKLCLGEGTCVAPVKLSDMI